jgi:hypothetical protein
MKYSQIATFANIIKGKRAELAGSYPVIGEKGPVEIPVLLVPLGAAEEAERLEFASAYAARKGAPDAKADHPLYELAYMAKTIEIGVLDPDSPDTARERHFASVDEILSDDFPRETLAYLFAAQDAWQDQTSPSVRKLSDEQMFAAALIVGKGGSEGEAFFDRLSPGTQRRFALTMAVQLHPLLAQRFGSGSPSTGASTVS